MRMLAPVFVAAPPSGARIRTRLRLTPQDEAVLWAVGRHLGTLASRDLAARCGLGRDGGRRAGRKRALTAASSSRWAGAITRTSNDQWQRAYRNLADQRAGLARASRTIRARLGVEVGQRQGRVRGYASQTERFEKQRRLQHLTARLAEVDRRLAGYRVSVCRGGRRLAKLRHAVADAKLTTAGWRRRWEAERLFLTADGEADKAWGNETIRVHPDEGWLELRLPTPLAHLSNTPGRAATYRLGCPVRFTHRVSEWAAQAASGAIRYDIHLHPTNGTDTGRWYLDASWRFPAVAPPSLEELRTDRAVAVDLNADHLASWVLSPSGSPVGAPSTIPLDIDGHSAATRDGRLRAAISAVIGQAKAQGCRSIIIEDLDFSDARQTGRENLGRGPRARRFRRTIGQIPTGAFRDLLVGMAANAGLWVIVVDRGWTSKWGGRYWKTPLDNETRRSVTVTGHHAASVVIGRRGLWVWCPAAARCDRQRPEDGCRRATGGAGYWIPGGEGTGWPGGQRAAGSSV